MTITTIIPTYNRSGSLKNSINSILNQTYQDFIICVYDDNSPDDTEEVVRQLASKDNRIKYVKHVKNMGVMPNFIHGISKVKTTFFNLLSDDDTVNPNFFESAIKALTDHPQAAFYAGATQHCDQHGNVFGNPVGNWEKEGIYEPVTGFVEMIEKAHPDWTGILFRTSVLEKVFPDINVGYAADYDFELRIAAEFPIYISKEVVANFNLHMGSESFKARLHGMWPAWHYLIENIKKNESLDPALRDKVTNVFTKRIVGRIFRTGLKSIVREDYKECTEAAKILNQEFGSFMKSRILTTSASLIRKIRGLRFLLKSFILIGAFYRRKTGLYKF